MSEQEIVKNYPGSPTVGHQHAGDGAFASGDIGGATATSPTTSDIGANLGNIAVANFGANPAGPNAVNPTGTPGGILLPEQARRFIDYVWDATVLAKDGRRVTMRANTMELEKVNVGERVIRAAARITRSPTLTFSISIVLARIVTLRPSLARTVASHT